MNASAILSALSCGRSGCACARGVNTHCPGPAHANGDRDPSLHISENPNGANPLVRCFGGCTQDQVVEALKGRELWTMPESTLIHDGPRRGRPAAPGSPTLRGEPVAIYHYRNTAGEVVAEKARFETSAGKTFLWRRIGDQKWTGLRGLKQADFALWGMELLTERPADPVIVTEGEKAAQACRDQGLLALCHGGGAATADFGRSLDVLAGRDVIVWPDNDEVGRAYAERLIAALPGGTRVSVCTPPVPPKGDAYEYFAAGGTAEGLATFTVARSPLPRPSNGMEEDDTWRPAAEPYLVSTSSASFVTEWIDYARQCVDAPWGAHELMAVGALSALAGPKPRLPFATSRRGVQLSIWTMYIVNSTDGRKSVVTNLIYELLEEVLGSQAIMTWDASPQGLIDRLADRAGQPLVWIRDEYSGILALMNRMSGHMAGMHQTLIRAYDGGRLENVRTKKRNSEGEKVSDTTVVVNPYFVTISASTWDSFMHRASIDNVLDGFLARFIFYTGAASPARIPIDNDALKAQFARLVERARDYAIRCNEIEELRLHPDVYDEMWEVEQASRALALKHPRPSMAGPMLKRLDDSVMKIAALLALDESDGPFVTVNPMHYAAAQEMGRRWRRYAFEVMDALGATPELRAEDAVLKTVVNAPGGITMSALLRAHRSIKHREMREIIDHLTGQEMIETLEIQTSGRPGVMVLAHERARRLFAS